MAGYSQTARPTREFRGFLPAPRSYLSGQFPGEHMGLGAPPSANDMVDAAPSNSSVASSKCIIFFMEISLVRSIKNTKPPY